MTWLSSRKGREQLKKISVRESLPDETPNVSMKGIGIFLRALISCLHPVRLAYVGVSIRAALPVAKALQLIVFGSLSNPFADRISVAD